MGEVAVVEELVLKAVVAMVVITASPNTHHAIVDIFTNKVKKLEHPYLAKIWSRLIPRWLSWSLFKF